jgi:hypothetical protein
MKKSELYAALRREIHRHDFSTYADEPPSIAQGGRGVVVPGCPTCKNLHTCAIATDCEGYPAMPDGTPRLGMRVRLSPEFYAGRLISTCEWTGIIKRITSVGGQRTYTVEIDPQFGTAEETEVDALAEEMEPHETNE